MKKLGTCNRNTEHTHAVWEITQHECEAWNEQQETINTQQERINTNTKCTRPETHNNTETNLTQVPKQRHLTDFITGTPKDKTHRGPGGQKNQTSPTRSPETQHWDVMVTGTRNISPKTWRSYRNSNTGTTTPTEPSWRRNTIRTPHPQPHWNNL